MVQAMMFEIFVLAIVNELYFQRIRTDEVWAEGERRLQQKIALIQSYQQQQQAEDPPFFGIRFWYAPSL